MARSQLEKLYTLRYSVSHAKNLDHNKKELLRFIFNSSFPASFTPCIKQKRNSVTLLNNVYHSRNIFFCNNFNLL